MSSSDESFPKQTAQRAIPKRLVSSVGDYTYLVGKQIGAGSSGGVYLCKREPDGLLCAVKAIRVDQLHMSSSGRDYKEEMKSLYREIHILRSLKHRRIVELFDVVEDEYYVFIIMEYVEGGELFARITDDPAYRNEDVVKYLFVQVVEAVLYMHAQNVIHRDLKAENVLIKSSLTTPPEEDSDIPNLPAYPQIKVTDFGLSKQMTDQSSLATTWVGTPQYWAPEVLLSRDTGKPYDGRVDIWSLGVLLYVTLGKRYPFAETSKISPLPMNERILRGIFDFNCGSREIPKLAQDLIMQLIVPDPSKRLALEDVFTHPWLADFPPAQRASQIWTPTPLDYAAISEVNAQPIVLTPTLQLQVTQQVPQQLSVLPNVALNSSGIPLAELARCQTEITRALNRIMLQLRGRPQAQRVASELMRRARELHFLSAKTITQFAVTAETVEAVLVDAQAFVDAGVPAAALECMEEVRGHVVEMHGNSQVVQTEYRRLAADVHKLLRGAEQASPPPTRLVQEEPPTATMRLLNKVNTGELGGLSDEQQLDLLEILGLLNLSQQNAASPTVTETVALRADDQVNLLSLAARDLRRVDAILERCRFFWSNVEHCVLRLNQFKDAAGRLLEHARASQVLYKRYTERMTAHCQFWQAFRATCKDYADQAQLEYQQAVDNAAALADALDAVSRSSN